MSNKHFVITIERQYGSGGRLTGSAWQKNWAYIFTMKRYLR